MAADKRTVESLHSYLRYMAARPWHPGTPAQNMANAWKELDAHLSNGGTPPEEWREGPDDVPADDDPACGAETGAEFPCGWPAGHAYPHQGQHAYTRAEIADGTGFAPDARFVQL